MARIALSTGPRGKFVGLMESTIHRIMRYRPSGHPLDTPEVISFTAQSVSGPQNVGVMLSLAEARHLAERIAELLPATEELAPVKEVPSAV